ncbi:intraflagellar transport protein 25 homolog isoform X3 [Anolis sagrei]|uniref:intraflagellar transport protein 25 homolog isoform X3 n=1 Tax=Anolis sagrei TaxID=38937 RepID=UPI0035220AA0
MKFTDYGLRSEGAEVVLATSSDEKFPPENIIDGLLMVLSPEEHTKLPTRRSDTFWMTTGMFPQEFIISLNKCVTINKLTIQCYLELQSTEGELQIEEFSFPDMQAAYLRFIILSAFDAFVSVHRVIVEGIA